jgi:hypothetical protein
MQVDFVLGFNLERVVNTVMLKCTLELCKRGKVAVLAILLSRTAGPYIYGKNNRVVHYTPHEAWTVRLPGAGVSVGVAMSSPLTYLGEFCVGPCRHRAECG